MHFLGGVVYTRPVVDPSSNKVRACAKPLHDAKDEEGGDAVQIIDPCNIGEEGGGEREEYYRDDCVRRSAFNDEEHRHQIGCR